MQSFLRAARRRTARSLDPAQTRQQRHHGVRSLRSPPLGRQIERRAASSRRRHLLPADGTARRGLRQREQRGDLRAERPEQRRRLLDLAGGLTTTAQARRATLERIDERQTRTVDQFLLDYDGLRRPIRDGDLNLDPSDLAALRERGDLRGNVAEPLRYPWREGLRVRDLIPDRKR